MNFVRHLKKQYLIKYEESELVRNVFANTYILFCVFEGQKRVTTFSPSIGNSMTYYTYIR